MNKIPKKRIIRTNDYLYTGMSLGTIKHGYGELVIKNTKSVGYWFFDVMHGEQKLYVDDVCVFEGTYINGLKHGHGIEYIDGIKYTGTFSNGLKHGSFVIEHDASFENVVYSNDVVISPCKTESPILVELSNSPEKSKSIDTYNIISSFWSNT